MRSGGNQPRRTACRVKGLVDSHGLSKAVKCALLGNSLAFTDIAVVIGLCRAGLIPTRGRACRHSDAAKQTQPR